MQHMGFRSSSQQPVFFAQSQTELRLFPIKKEAFIQHANIFNRWTRNKDAGAIEGVEPVIVARFYAVTRVAYPQIDACASPCLNCRRCISVVTDRGDCAYIFTCQGFCDE